MRLCVPHSTFDNTRNVVPERSPGGRKILIGKVVGNRLAHRPQKSLCHLAQKNGLSYGSCHNVIKRKEILRNVVCLFPKLFEYSKVQIIGPVFLIT